MANQLAAWGYVLFPLAEGTKNKPRVRWRNGGEDERATCDRAVIEAHWRDNPRDNIGIDCAESLLFVIDVDSQDAWGWLDDLWSEHEGAGLDNFDGPVIRTRRGKQLYFEAPIPMLCGTVGLVHPDIDTRGNGNMVCGPGSVVRYDGDGNLVPPVTYTLESGGLEKPPPLRPWLETILRSLQKKTGSGRLPETDPWPEWTAGRQLEHRVRLVANAPDGRRNDTLHDKAAYPLRRALAVFGPEYIGEQLLDAALSTGLRESDAKATICSGLGCNPWKE